MSYRCPVCRKIFNNWEDTAKHLTNNRNHISEHHDWFDAHHVDTTSIFSINKGEIKVNYASLKDIIEKECKISY